MYEVITVTLYIYIIALGLSHSICSIVSKYIQCIQLYSICLIPNDYHMTTLTVSVPTMILICWRQRLLVEECERVEPEKHTATMYRFVQYNHGKFLTWAIILLGTIYPGDLGLFQRRKATNDPQHLETSLKYSIFFSKHLSPL